MAYDISENYVHIYQHDAPTQELAEVSADAIMSLKTSEQVSYLGDELAYDTMDLEAMQERTFENGSAVYGTELTAFPYGSPVRHTNAGGDIDRTFYIDTSSRIGNHVFRYDCASIIAMLDRQVFPGAIFRGYKDSTTNKFTFYKFPAALRYIVGASGTLFDYDCSNVANEIVFGWIPYGTRRHALQQLLFATNIHAFWDAVNRRVVFDYIDHASAGTIADAEIFDTGKVEYPQLATKIIVVEHDFFYFNSGHPDYVVLYDNTQGNVANGELIKFSTAPIVPTSLTASGTLTFTNATTDSAIVSGRGILKGYPWYHTTFQIERNANVATRKEYEVSVTDVYLISFLNSENVADRLADYYFNRYIVKADIKYNDEQAGKYYALKDAFGENQAGYLQKIDKVYSSFVKASCEFLCGVNEEYDDVAFDNFHVIYHNTKTYNDTTDPDSSPLTGTWTVPDGVHRIRVILIGGGKGGDSGTPGEPGKSAADGGTGGKGGVSGAPGHGGSIYITSIDVNPGDVFNYSLGEGGAGGAVLTYADYQTLGHVRYGAEGGDTTFQKTGGTLYSSADGTPSDIGYCFDSVNAMEAMPGTNYVGITDGCDGGDAGQTSDNASETEKRRGTDGGTFKYSTATYQGGYGGSGTFVSAPTSFKTIINQAYTALTGLYYVANGTNPPPVWYAYTSASDKQGLWNNAKIGQNYIDYTGWKCSVGIPGGGGGGACFGAAGTSGGAGYNASAYPTNFYGDYDTGRVLRDGDPWCWHETNTTHGGNGGNGASVPANFYLQKPQFSLDTNYGTITALGQGGSGGFGGGGGGGAAASVAKQATVQWLFTEFVEGTSTPGTGGSAGKAQDGADGGIIIYY